MIEILDIEDMKRPPVSPDEFWEAYGVIKRHCDERWDCEGCYMEGICYSDCLPPKQWPEPEAVK